MNECWLWVQATFKNREIATGIWLLFAFTLCLFLKNIRSSMWSILTVSMQRQLLILFGSLVANITGLCWLLFWLGLWTPDQFASTILWFLLSGLALTGRTLSVKEDQDYFKNLFRDSFKVVGIFEFLVVAYSFSLPVELVFVPFMAFIGLMIGFADIKEEHASVKTLFEWIAFVVVVVLLWKSVGSIWEQPEAFFTTLTGRNFLLPSLLAVGSIPFLYIWYCYSHIEVARIQIDCKTFQSEELKRYARKRFFLTFMTRPWLLRRATRQFHIIPANTNSDVDKIIADILIHERHSKSPPKVDKNLGWSPYLARDFLKAEGLQTDDYHSDQDGTNTKWWASSNYVDLDNQVFPNSVSFYVEGLRELATTLKLKGQFRDDFDPTLAKERFNEIAQALLERSISGDLHRAQDAIRSDKDFALAVDNKMWVARSTERYPNGKGFELHFILVRGTTRR